MVSAYMLMVLVYWLFRRSSPSKMDKYFRKLQLLSAAAFSLSHGSNDAQKTMGIDHRRAGGVAATRRTFEIPVWVILAAYAAIALGTLSGGWRIVRTMGTADAAQTAQRILRRDRRGGRGADRHHLGLPVSTTHAIAGAIAGVGSIQRLKAVRWGIATNIMWAWVLTIPMAALIAWMAFFALHLAIGA
jgi:PiT family inorganic phosphate transporter